MTSEVGKHTKQRTNERASEPRARIRMQTLARSASNGANIISCTAWPCRCEAAAATAAPAAMLASSTSLVRTFDGSTRLSSARLGSSYSIKGPAPRINNNSPSSVYSLAIQLLTTASAAAEEAAEL